MDTLSLSPEETSSLSEETIARINDTPYGWQAGIFIRDLIRAFQLADAIHSDSVVINVSSDYRIDVMPFGDVKRSGLRCEGASFAIRKMTKLKTYCFNLQTGFSR